ncbi:Tyrosine recombinase XerC [Limihaloglobus sulfuriphilus]|uniref:Tyrosine recombinase XerC n=1 Tax=Limihaloglobus sulfuriphilus TaxID=1851148 RepID=A0A1Q2MGB3_9BACT|nr:tyrosine-type recombinase/integrase [Limihaloglobus sulfuriphilus]AQQ71721.1 Tyrosine recombinase XerC [Limihaloglobus sulfuriphilus]
MASMAFHKDCGKWRVFWHVTLPNGEVDKGSMSFKDRKKAKNFKEHCEERQNQLKKAIFVEDVFLDEAIIQWKDFCLGFTKATRYLYTREIDKFKTFLNGEVVYASELETAHIRDYLNYMLRKKLSNKTVNNILCAIKSLCKYITENYKLNNPAKDIKKLKEDPPNARFWTLEEYRRVLKNCPDYVQRWIRFIACTGLRAHEFCNLKWGNCDLEKRTITIIGKGRKKRTIGLNDIALGILEGVNKGERVIPDALVFVNDGGRALTRYNLAWHIGEACRDAGLPGGGPHAARHFFATQLLLRGVPIIKVSALLGHASVTTTQRHYSHILSADLSDVTSVLAV